MFWCDVLCFESRLCGWWFEVICLSFWFWKGLPRGFVVCFWDLLGDFSLNSLPYYIIRRLAFFAV